MNKKKVYISGKISGSDYDEAFDKFERAENWLSLIGLSPINPMKKVSEQEGKSWKDYMLEDIAILWECDGIYMLPDWKDSKGARIEFQIALELDLIITFGK